MTEKHLKESYTQEENSTVKKQNGAKLIQTVSVVFLPPLWVGFFYSLYKGNEFSIGNFTHFQCKNNLCTNNSRG